MESAHSVVYDILGRFLFMLYRDFVACFWVFKGVGLMVF